ncbi:MAG: U32 family peptidase [Lachnospiraceae bacterium]|nr:U32 family peptidase [Lachnospiraceae bacterium]
MEKQNRVELLAPAGSYESMTAAVCAGADAVYLGGQLFGARAYANNLDEEQLKQAIDYVHLHKKALYLTVNTLLKEEELEEKLYSYIKPLYEQGLDAVIVQDMGVFAFIREYFPKLPIHASTQMTLTGVYGAKLLKELGAQRIVTARELTLQEIAQIHKQTDIEIESFIHGALCYCYSGQCLFSSIAGGRSGNRGRCAQPCRLPYTQDGRKQYYLSPKDLSTLTILTELIEAGIYSLKIEGRMKKPEYTAGVVSIYRKYLDLYLAHGEGYRYRVEDKDAKTLFDIYNRGGFTEGYYKKHNGKDMMFLQGREGDGPERNDALFENIRKNYIDREKKEPLTGSVTVIKGEPARMTIHFEHTSATVLGENVQEAQKQPLDEQKIRKQMEKLGNTPYFWESLEIITDQAGFLPVTSLNELRRQGIDKLKEELLSPYRRQTAEPHIYPGKSEKADIPANRKPLQLHVYLEKTEYAESLLALDGVDALYLDSCVYDTDELSRLVLAGRQYQKKLFYVLPHIFRAKEADWLDGIYEELLQSGIDGFVVKNYEEMEYLKEKSCPLAVRCDYTVYAYNQRAAEMLREYLAPEFITLPVELNSRELKHLSAADSELLVYGRIPMMVSAQCVRQNTKGCSKTPELMTITDRYNNEFPVKNQCRFCYNRIYNCKPLSLLSRKKEITDIAPGAVRLDFTTETVKEAAAITKAFINAYKNGASYTEEPWDFTRGHFSRGIE